MKRKRREKEVQRDGILTEMEYLLKFQTSKDDVF